MCSRYSVKDLAILAKDVFFKIKINHFYNYIIHDTKKYIFLYII